MIAIPEFLSHLPVYGEIPVPFMFHWRDGKPDFRVLDPQKLFDCYRLKLCAICGHTLGESSYWIGGPSCGKQHYFSDGPMHKACADFSLKACPFLRGERGYSQKTLPDDTAEIEGTVTVRPAEMFMFRSRTAKTRLVPVHRSQSVLFEAGPWIGKQAI